MTYAEKLRDPRWQKKRLQILERDKWRCKACHSADKNLQVHHLYYARLDPWEYPDHVYQTLCDDCHGVRQRIVDRAVERIRLNASVIPTENLRQILTNAENVVMVASSYFAITNAQLEESGNNK